MATVDAQAEILSNVTEGSVVLEGVSWETYERLLEGIGERRVFVTYDNGTMEIQTMSPSYRHENHDRLLERLIYAISLLQDVPVHSGGSVTMRHPSLRKGLEPDACFWFASEKAMRGAKELDLTELPPPDLVIEIDVHSGSVDRIEAYRTLGVKEIWWVRPLQGLCFLALDDTRNYEEVEQSVNLPQVRCDIVARALGTGVDLSENQRLNQLLVDLGIK